MHTQLTAAAPGQMATEHARAMPIFWGHGTHDPLVKYQFGVDSVEFLKTDVGIAATTLAGADTAALRGIAFNSYSGLGHSASDKELADLKEWLKKVVAAP